MMTICLYLEYQTFFFIIQKYICADHHDLEYSQDTIVQCEDGSLPLPSLLLGRLFHLIKI